MGESSRAGRDGGDGVEAVAVGVMRARVRSTLACGRVGTRVWGVEACFALNEKVVQLGECQCVANQLDHGRNRIVVSVEVGGLGGATKLHNCVMCSRVENRVPTFSKCGTDNKGPSLPLAVPFEAKIAFAAGS